MTNFSQLNLPEQILQALHTMNFSTPTPIQAQAVPVALQGRDLIGCAQTGTGKTAAFSIPLMARLLENPEMNALILVPTRELAVQISDVLKKLSSATPDFKIALLIGGADYRPQYRALQNKPRIVIGTPGRCIDHVKQRSLSLAKTGILVLDEADRMMDMGFAPQLQEVQRYLPQQRQTLFFSATLPADILKLARQYLKDPVRITIGQVSKPTEMVNQQMIQTVSSEKNEVLLDELNRRDGTVIVFVRTKQRSDKIANFLEDYGHAVTRIHGGRSQGQRNKAISGFRSGEFRIMVATDVAARGLDIPHIAHVINFDLPECAEDYVHRIGRTARAGAKGEAVSIVMPEDQGKWRNLARTYNLPAFVKGQKAQVVGKSSVPDRINAEIRFSNVKESLLDELIGDYNEERNEEQREEHQKSFRRSKPRVVDFEKRKPAHKQKKKDFDNGQAQFRREGREAFRSEKPRREGGGNGGNFFKKKSSNRRNEKSSRW